VADTRVMSSSKVVVQFHESRIAERVFQESRKNNGSQAL
jgi:hypothetical protein